MKNFSRKQLVELLENDIPSLYNTSLYIMGGVIPPYCIKKDY